MVQLSRYFFFSENAKNLGWSDDAKRRKKRRMAVVAKKVIVCFPMYVLRENIIHLTVKFCFRYFEV